MYINPYKSIYQAVKNNKPEVSNVFINSLNAALRAIEEKTGVHFIITKKCDLFHCLYVVENGFRKKICDIKNNSSIAEVINFVKTKIKA